MWKPGSQKPGGSSSKKKKNKGGKSPSSSSIGGLQIPEASPLQHATTINGQSPSQNETSATTPESQSRKKLSGSTMNMRFMQRHSQQHNHSSRSPPSRSKSRERSQSPKSHPSNSPHSLQQQQQQQQFSAGAEIAVPTPTNNTNNHDQQRIIMADDDENDDDGASDVDMKDASSSSSRYGVATSADMYGYSHVAVIGRRSFGGCNPTMAEAWQLSQQAERDDAQQQSVSDKELVKRYLQSRKSADRQKAVGPRHDGSQYSKGKNKKRQKTSLS